MKPCIPLVRECLHFGTSDVHSVSSVIWIPQPFFWLVTSQLNKIRNSSKRAKLTQGTFLLARLRIILKPRGFEHRSHSDTNCCFGQHGCVVEKFPKQDFVQRMSTSTTLFVSTACSWGRKVWCKRCLCQWQTYPTLQPYLPENELTNWCPIVSLSWGVWTFNLCWITYCLTIK